MALNFDERLYTLDVGEVHKEAIPRIIDPNDAESNTGTVVCYNPTKDQFIQLALIIWQVSTRERNALQVRTKKFEVAEELVTRTRNVLISLLLPFVEGNSEKARDLCVTLLLKHKPTFDKYIEGWSIIKRPNSVWVDKEAKGIFLCKNEGRILVGLNPTNYVFVYNDQGK